MANLVDQYLLYRIRAKADKQAFARLYDRYVVSIYRFVFLKLPSKEMAEDVTSETFLKCWHYVQQNKEINNFRALLYEIARNLVVDTYRKNGARLKGEAVSVSVTFLPPATSHLMEETDVSDSDKGRAIMEARADVSLVIERMAKLKEDYRDVLMLRLVDGLAFADIAKILEKTPGHVRVIYHRAMKALEQT